MDLAEALRHTELERLRALREADMAVAESLHAAGYELVTPAGSVLSRPAYLGAIAAGTLRYLAFEPVSQIAARVTAGAAALRYRARIKIEEGPASTEFTCWHTDYYELISGRWQAVWSQATRIP